MKNPLAQHMTPATGPLHGRNLWVYQHLGIVDLFYLPVDLGKSYRRFCHIIDQLDHM